MRSEYAEWLDQMQHVADAGNITVAARHHDVLVYYFRAGKTPQEAFEEYSKKFLPRWNAITHDGMFTGASGGISDNEEETAVPEVKGKIIQAFVYEQLNKVHTGRISFSRFVELINQEAEKVYGTKNQEIEKEVFNSPARPVADDPKPVRI